MATPRLETFKGQSAWVLENEVVRVVILPDLGTKMASLVHKRTGRELLFQRDDWPTLPQPAYAAAFGDYDVSGIDDMFPTIDVCRYVGGPWDGTVLPDHGEVWAIPWDCRAAGEALVASVHGWRLPYRLDKRITLHAHGGVRIDYTATNLAGVDLDVLWAAHPLCFCNESTRIVLPAGVPGLVNAHANSSRFAGYASRAAWPTITAPNGQTSRLDVIGSPTTGRSEKFWFDGPMPAGWAALHHTDTNEVLAFGWPVAAVPYLGLWLTEGAYQGLYHVAPEPATAPMDRPDIALKWGRGWSVPARGSRSWYLTLTAGQQTTIGGVGPDGQLL